MFRIMRSAVTRLVTPKGMPRAFKTVVDFRTLVFMTFDDRDPGYILKAVLILVGVALAILAELRLGWKPLLILSVAAYVVAGVTDDWVITATNRLHGAAQLITHLASGLFTGLFVYLVHTAGGGGQRGDAVLALVLVAALWLYEYSEKPKRRQGGNRTTEFADIFQSSGEPKD